MKKLNLIMKIIFYIGMLMISTAFMISVLKTSDASKGAAISLFCFGLGIMSGSIISLIDNKKDN